MVLRSSKGGREAVSHCDRISNDANCNIEINLCEKYTFVITISYKLQQITTVAVQLDVDQRLSSANTTACSLNESHRQRRTTQTKLATF